MDAALWFTYACVLYIYEQVLGLGLGLDHFLYKAYMQLLSSSRAVYHIVVRELCVSSMCAQYLYF